MLNIGIINIHTPNINKLKNKLSLYEIKKVFGNKYKHFIVYLTKIGKKFKNIIKKNIILTHRVI